MVNSSYMFNMKSQQITFAIVILIIFEIKGQKRIKSTCGRRLIHHKPVIFNGLISNEGDWPWHAAIFHFGNDDIQQYKCGGTLINSNTILTAAHCVYENDRPIIRDRVSVHLGRHNIRISGTNTQEFQVFKIIPHENYNTSDLSNDIAIIQLSTDATLNYYVQPICLWDSNKVEISEVIGRFGTVIGFGVTETYRISKVLRQAVMPVVSHLTCLKSNRGVFGMFLSEENFCAGFRNGTSVCSGDSGGSITFQENGVYHIRGIVSLAVARDDETRSCNSEEYALFTDVAKYLTWIKKEVHELPSPPVALSLLDVTVMADSLDLIESISKFSHEFYWTAIDGQNSNIILSPFFIHMALGLVYLGSKGKTAYEMTRALRLRGTRQSISEQYRQLIEPIKNNSMWKVANKVYVSDKYQIKKEFDDIARLMFNSESQTLDFAEKTQSANTINTWLENKMNKKNEYLISSDAFGMDARIVLVNAIYFKGFWKQFKKDRTYRDSFYTSETLSNNVHIMQAKNYFRYGVFEDLDAKLLELQYYESDMSMFIFLPNKRSGLAKLENDLRTLDLHMFSKNMYRKVVDVRIPKFKIQFTLSLVDTLKKLGMTDMFSQHADFGDLCDNPEQIYISDVVHSAIIQANEDEEGSADPDFVNSSFTGEVFLANHPFMFFLANSNRVYLIGRLIGRF